MWNAIKGTIVDRGGNSLICLISNRWLLWNKLVFVQSPWNILDNELFSQAINMHIKYVFHLDKVYNYNKRSEYFLKLIFSKHALKVHFDKLWKSSLILQLFSRFFFLPEATILAFKRSTRTLVLLSEMLVQYQVFFTRKCFSFAKAQHIFLSMLCMPDVW